jgi:hypothetical protein
LKDNEELAVPLLAAAVVLAIAIILLTIASILEPFDFRLFQDLGAACDQATR